MIKIIDDRVNDYMQKLIYNIFCLCNRNAIKNNTIGLDEITKLLFRFALKKHLWEATSNSRYIGYENANKFIKSMILG